jgi:hypothetical protein
MKGEETYSSAEASRVLGRSGRKSEEGDRLIAELEERAERRHLAEHLEAEQRRGFWSRLFGREVARRFGRYRGYADFHAGGNFVLTEFPEVRIAPVLCRSPFLSTDREASRLDVYKTPIIQPVSITLRCGPGSSDWGYAPCAIK